MHPAPLDILDTLARYSALAQALRSGLPAADALAAFGTPEELDHAMERTNALLDAVLVYTDQCREHHTTGAMMACYYDSDFEAWEEDPHSEENESHEAQVIAFLRPSDL